MSLRIGVWGLITLFFILLVALYLIFDPGATWWMPKCPIHVITGWDCPGCGTQRAFHALLHGDFTEALRQNAILFIVVPFLIVSGYSELARNRHPRLFNFIYHPVTIISLTVMIIGWGVLRNFLPL